MKMFITLCLTAFLVGLAGLQTGCALRVSVTPITAEEIVQKSVTNQFFDWMFKGSEAKKS